MNQITIYELLPLLRSGFVSMDSDGEWVWWETEPQRILTGWVFPREIKNKKEISYAAHILNNLFNIAPFDGDWKDSLMECGDHIADASK